MSTVCRQCSAHWTDGSCHDAFDRALALEFTDVRLEYAQTYRDDVEAWAQSVMDDTASVTR